MGAFDTERKSQVGYLDIAANGNGGEKAMLTLEALSRLKTCGKDTSHVIEIGPGGGAALDAICDVYECDGDTHVLPVSPRVTFVELDGVASESLSAARERFSKYGETVFRLGDASKLSTVVPEGADVVAASAVLHEVFSYGGGYKGLDRTMSSIAETLNPGGYFAYRDVYSVDDESQHDRKRHIYNRESWVAFAKLFLPHYLDNARHPYHHEDDKVIFEQDSRRVFDNDIDPRKYLSINAPVGVLRELQRHYITLRDYCWREGVLGFVPYLEGDKANDWLDVKKGAKRVHYKVSDESFFPDNLLATISEKAEDGHYTVDGDLFDITTDAELGKFLNKVLAQNPAAFKVWEEWLRREGSETYVYMTPGRLLAAIALRSLEATDGQGILLPERPSDVLFVDRRYYNRYLQNRLSNPLPDGKQLALLRLLNPREDQAAIGGALDTLSDHCTREIISRIYGPIRKAM